MKKLNAKETSELLDTLRRRFTANMNLHKGIEWNEVEAKLKVNPTKLASLWMMEDTGGEPDVIAYDKKTNEFLFTDTSPESPKGRRSLCYDREALNARKANKPANSAMDLAKEIGITILDETHYRELQKLVPLDLKSSSWIMTPEKIRKLGGALFCDRRYDTVFVFHNGAESYYAERGFRGLLRI
jgi:hypothetical protein